MSVLFIWFFWSYFCLPRMLGSEASSQIISVPKGPLCIKSSNQAEQSKAMRSVFERVRSLHSRRLCWTQ